MRSLVALTKCTHPAAAWLVALLLWTSGPRDAAAQSAIGPAWLTPDSRLLLPESATAPAAGDSPSVAHHADLSSTVGMRCGAGHVAKSALVGGVTGALVGALLASLRSIPWRTPTHREVRQGARPGALIGIGAGAVFGVASRRSCEEKVERPLTGRSGVGEGAHFVRGT